ncbi:MAG: ABC-F family ATP-binding cassette domain-containing protein [Candidatus Korobacteraceae bacterium]|jgi:ATP-binding cassette subfamily F protein 3
MIQLSSAGKRFGPKLLFDNLDWLITPHDRVGLVGANGTGKSTLLKILGGMESLDYGGMTAAKNTTFGYLPQDGLQLSGRTVFDECMSVFSDLRALEHEMEDLAHKIGELDHTSGEYAQVADRYQRISGEFHMNDGYALDSRVGTVLDGLGFRKEDWTRYTEEFSGGWQMRIALAKLLLAKPNLLLLDEPTNHLDLETRNWLEQYLLQYPYAYLVISHDRYFLDVTVDRIVEIWNKRLQFYSGNYEKYLQQKQERRDSLVAAYKNQRERIEQLEAFINRFRYQATKAKQVQSRIKELEKVERIEIPPEEKTIHFTFPQPKPSGRLVVECSGVAKSYGEKEVFRDVSFTIQRGDRIALVGINGAGKSTLIKLLTGTEPLTAGTMRLGHNVEPDYFAQDQYKELDPERRMLDDLTDIAPQKTMTELRGLLGSFLFSEDDVFKPIGVLSGGERNRYALARMLLHPSNFLLLDEPTNHLDMRAKDVLLESLEKYNGTVVFVSHDRYFIDKLAMRVFEIGGGRVEVFPGNYEDYVWRKQRETSGGDAPESADGNGPGNWAPTLSDVPGYAEQKAQSKKRVNPIKLKQIRERHHQVEEDIARLEDGIAECERELQSFVSAAETARWTELLAKRRSELQPLMAEWEDLSQTLETT